MAQVLRRRLSATTSSPKPSTSSPPGASALDGPGDARPQYPPPKSPALSTASTADGDDADLETSPSLPPLPAPKLPDRVSALLRSPTQATGHEAPFETASWGSPYPPSHHNLRRQSFSSDLSDDSPLHHLAIDTPFLRPAPELSQPEADSRQPLSAAAAVLANSARRSNRGLTEDWIRAHTAGDVNIEPRLWFSDGSDSEHSSLSGSDLAWLDERDSRTPRAVKAIKAASRKQSRHPRAKSSVETLKPGDGHDIKLGNTTSMSNTEPETMLEPVSKAPPQQDESTGSPAEEGPLPPPANMPAEALSEVSGNAMAAKPVAAPEQAAPPTTPKKLAHKPLPKEPPMTPRIKKKVPWKGKNIMILVPRDDERGMPGKSPMPLRPDETKRMFDSWKELGYSVDGFDLLVEGYQPPGTADAQSRDCWPAAEDMVAERSTGKYKVTLPDLNAWQNYVNELQEAKLRALGVSLPDEEPPAPSVSPSLTNTSRQASAQYPALPFSPPIPTSSASSNPGFAFQSQLLSGATSTTQSPGITSPIPFANMPNKFNPRQSISLPAGNSPFQQMQGWPNQAGILHNLSRGDSPSLSNFNGMMSPQSPYDMEGFPTSASPALNAHQRHQSLQYFPQQLARASPQLQQVREDEEEDAANSSKSPSKTPEPTKPKQPSFQAEMRDAEYHLEEQLRHQLEHEDYNPQTQADVSTNNENLATAHDRQASGNLAVSEHFANDPAKPVVLHHPRPHSRGQSVSQNFFDVKEGADESTKTTFDRLNRIPESAKSGQDESYEIETNPSDLGTPVQDFEFSAALGQHQKTASTTSNPWNEAAEAAAEKSMDRRSSHGSKPSVSKLNVQAPEFKFNPTSNFTPGQFNFSAASFQPTNFQSGMDTVVAPANTTSPVFGSDSFSSFTANAPSFAPGKSEFSFSTSGPKFRPDAPSFTPFQSLASSLTNPTVKGHQGRTDSIFGNIKINPSEIVRPMRKSKAIPIVRPSSSASARSPRGEASDGSDGEILDDADGRLASDESRVKRARSAAPEGKDIAAFAQMPEAPETTTELESEPKAVDGQGISDADDNNNLLVDTSMSSAIASEQAETKQTTAAPSVASPAEDLAHHTKARPSLDAFKKSMHKNSLSATAIPFSPGAASYGEETPVKKEPTDSTPAAAHQEPEPSSDATRNKVSPRVPDDSQFSSPAPRVKAKGLAASRFATAEATPEPQPEPMSEPETKPEAPAELEAQEEPQAELHDVLPDEPQDEPQAEPDAESEAAVEQDTHALDKEIELVLPSVETEGDLLDLGDDAANNNDGEPTFEEIDAVMQHLENDPTMGVNKSMERSKWNQPKQTTSRQTSSQLRAMANEFVPQFHSFSQPTQEEERHVTEPAAAMSNGELDDPFVDPPLSRQSPEAFNEFDEGQIQTEPASDWEAAFSEDEHSKLESRSQFFDGRVNEIVGNLLASRLGPLEKTLLSIQNALGARDRHTPPSRRGMRGTSTEMQESDADDEDDELVIHRSASPRKDRRMDQIRAAVTEALSAQRSHPAPTETVFADASTVLNALDDLKKHLDSGKFSSNATREVNDEVVSDHPLSRQVDEDLLAKFEELQSKHSDLEQRFAFEQGKVEKEVSERRTAEDAAAELNRKLQAAETRVEVEIINRSVYDQRVADLEERLRLQEEKTEEELKQRRAIEDKLCEAQRQVKAASEEETRLHDTLEERERRIKELEQNGGKRAIRMNLLEAAQNNATQSQSEMTNKVNALEADLKEVRQDNTHWRSEAQRADETARRGAGELAHAVEERKALQKTLDTLTAQLQENERLRESWRSKFMSLQDDMGQAARDVAEESARRIKKDQAMIARQEVLDARLQAEAKTRERLEVEMERLQENERSGMRAVNECNRLETLLGELRTENHKLHETAARYKREFDEARESGASEVKRTRMNMQAEVDTANNQVNIVRQDLEEQNSKLRTELDNVHLEADTAKERHEMLLEEAQSSKKEELDEQRRKYQDEMEDLQARLERQANNAVEDGQRTEEALLERLSFSSTKMEHLQDRIAHLEDKLEISKQAAAAAAQAAKAAGVEPGPAAAPVITARSTTAKTELPEKISPQALRESIMVLQEQLQAREQRIEELELDISKLDPEAPSKIAKRDDEISWLRELLAVRHGDLQEIITALSAENIDRERVKDAAIRLKANLQMEEQERERAMNGGSAITLPNIAQSIQAATPRVAQTIGSSLTAFDKWRKSSQPSFLSGVLNSPAAGHNNTPSKSSGPSAQQSNVLSGLLTPPASGLRQTPLSDSRAQPTAFASTGRRFPSQGSTQSRERGDSSSSVQVGKRVATAETTPPRRQEQQVADPVTPPMTMQSGYDSDAQPGDFDDHDFFED